MLHYSGVDDGELRAKDYSSYNLNERVRGIF